MFESLLHLSLNWYHDSWRRKRHLTYHNKLLALNKLKAIVCRQNCMRTINHTYRLSYTDGVCFVGTLLTLPAVPKQRRFRGGILYSSSLLSLSWRIIFISEGGFRIGFIMELWYTFDLTVASISIAYSRGCSSRSLKMHSVYNFTTNFSMLVQGSPSMTICSHLSSSWLILFLCSWSFRR